MALPVGVGETACPTSSDMQMRSVAWPSAARWVSQSADWDAKNEKGDERNYEGMRRQT